MYGKGASHCNQTWHSRQVPNAGVPQESALQARAMQANTANNVQQKQVRGTACKHRMHAPQASSANGCGRRLPQAGHTGRYRRHVHVLIAGRHSKPTQADEHRRQAHRLVPQSGTANRYNKEADTTSMHRKHAPQACTTRHHSQAPQVGTANRHRRQAPPQAP